MTERSARLTIHRALEAHLAARSDAALLDLLAGDPDRVGWGTSRTVEIDGRRVFVKAIPVTDRELADISSTANHFDLPTVYQYGVGSAGFGAARELAAHVTTSGWVVEGLTEHFPLLHHHRLLPLAGQTRQRDVGQLDRYTDYWDGNVAIRRYIEARQASEHAIVLFLEHIPDALIDWLPEHQEAIGWVIDQAFAATDFMRAQGVAHFDANPDNIITDGERIYFADMGLFLDRSFDLSDDARTFLAAHHHFDIAEFLASLTWPPPGREFDPTDAFRAALEPYREIIDEMTALFARLAGGPKTEGRYDDHHIAELLAAAR